MKLKELRRTVFTGSNLPKQAGKINSEEALNTSDATLREN
jgi:hypothetical protein